MYCVASSEHTEKIENSNKRVIKRILTHYVKQSCVRVKGWGQTIRVKGEVGCMGVKDQEVKN